VNRKTCFTVLSLLSLVIPAFSTTIALQGEFEPLLTDILVLDSVTSERNINYHLEPYVGNEFRFGMRCLNLDTLNWQFGDTVTGASFELYANQIVFAEVSGMLDAYFTGYEWPIPAEAIGESLLINVTLSENSDAISIYKHQLLVTDSIPPGFVGDMAAIDSFNNLLLSWTAPGDDNLLYRATAYEIKYSSAPVEDDTTAWWQNAISTNNPPSPLPPGSSESFWINNLDSNTTYYAVLVAVDELGNRSGYSNVASATTSAPRGNFCLRYDGAQYAEVPFDFHLNTGNQLTMEAWFYLDGSYDWNHASIIDKPAPQHDTPFYQYNMGPANHTDFYAQVAINGQYTPFELYGVVQTDTWTHAAVTYDGVSRIVYLNGAPIDSVYDPGQLDSYDTGIRFGALGNLESWFFKGYIDEIRIWDTARSQTEINLYMIHRLTGNEAFLVACWDFNNGMGQVFTDKSPNHIDGRLGNSDNPDDRDPAWVWSSAPVDTFVVDGVAEHPIGKPDKISLASGYPNPFNSGISIGFALPASGHVSLEIYDMLGRHVKTLADEPFVAGYHNIIWDGSSDSGQMASSGVYFYKMKSGEFEETQKLVMLK